MVQTSQKRVLFKHTLCRFLPGVFVVVAIFVSLLSVVDLFPGQQPEQAIAASAKTLNFQARLLTSSGAIVPDGDYNVEFKLFDAATSTGSSQGSCTGDANCMWTETRYDSNGATAGNDNRVRVKAGYLSVYLGDITDLPSDIWTKQLWLTMNIGGNTQTATPTWDGEMTPRLRLTAVPVAYSLTNYNTTTGYSSSLSLSGATGGNQTFTIPDQGAAGSYTLLTTQSANGGYIQNQSAADQTADFRVSGTGRANTALQAPLFDTPSAAALAIGTTNATQINLDQNTTIATGKSLTVAGGVSTFTGLAAGSSEALTVNTGAVDNKGIVVKAAASQSQSTIEVQNDLGSAIYKVKGNGTVSIGTDVGSAGLYVNNGTAGAGTVAQVIRGAASQSADMLQLQDDSGNINASFNGTGNQLTLGRISGSGTVTQGKIVFGDGTTSGFGATLQASTLTASRTFVFPDTSLATTASPGTICVYNGTSSNCPAATGSTYYLWNSTSVQTPGNFYLRSGAITDVTGVLEGANGQTADLLRLNTYNGTTSTTVARFTAAGNLQVAGSVDVNTATSLALGTVNANAISIGKAGVTTTNNGALTVSELLTGQAGATIAGGIVNVNTSSNFATNINTGTSTGAVSIGNNSNASNTVTIDGGTGASAIQIGNSATAHGIQIGTGAAAQTVAIGSGNSTSSLALQAGTSGVSLTTGSATGDSGSIFVQTGATSTGIAGNISIDNGTGSTGGGSLTINDDFEGCAVDDFVNWFGATISAANIGGSAHGGSCVLAVTETGGNGGFWGVGETYGSLSVTPGATYTVSVWVRAASVPQQLFGRIVWDAGDPSYLSDITTTTTGWTQMTGTVTAPPGAAIASLSIGNYGDGNGSSVTYFDDYVVNSNLNGPSINIGTSNANTITIGNGNQSGATSLQGGSAGMNINTLSNGTTAIGSAIAGAVTLQSGNAVTINAAAASSFVTTAGNLTVDSAATLNLGVTNATAVSIGHTGMTTTTNGALTVAQLFTGQLGATISGGTVDINKDSNNATNINTGTSTGAVTIGNASNTNNAVTIAAGATGAINLNSATIATNQTTVDVLNTTATTVHAFGAASTISLGAPGVVVGNTGSVIFQSTTSDQDTQAVIVKSNATQNGDLISYQSSAGALLGGVLANGEIWSAPSITTPRTQIPAARAYFQANAAGTTGLLIRASLNGTGIASDGPVLQAQNKDGSANIFTVGASGILTLAGNQSIDVTTATNGTSNPITIAPGNSTTNSGAGSALTLRGSNQTGTASTGGAVTITGGTGTATNGAVNVQAGINGATNINTGGSTGLVSIGGGSATFQLDTANIDISSAGAISNATGFTFAAGAYNFDTSSSTGTFKTTTGAVSLNGDTTIATGKNFLTSKGTDYSTTGSTDNVVLNGALIRLTGASAQTITGISAGTSASDGRRLTLVNSAAQAATLSNDSTSSNQGNRITTGTGSSLTIPAGGSVELIYDWNGAAATSFWRVVGSSAATSGYANTLLSNLGSTNINAALNATSNNLTLQTTTSGQIILNSASNVIDLRSNVSNSTGNLVLDDVVTIGTSGVSQLFGGGDAGFQILSSPTWTASTDSQWMQVRTGSTNAATSNSGNLELGTGDATVSGNTGGVQLSSGNATSGNSGSVTIDVGTASGTTGAVGIGQTNANSVSIGRTGVVTTNGGSLTVVELLAGQAGATIAGDTINLNDDSNFATNINTGTSTGAVTIGNGTSTAGAVSIQGGASSSFSVTNATGTTKLGFAAPSTAGTVTFNLPAGGVGGNSYGVCTTLAVCTGYQAAPVSGSYLQQVPTSDAANTVSPHTSGVVGLTVNGTDTGTAATALNVVQAGAASGLTLTSSGTGSGQGIYLTNTAGTQTNGLLVERNGAGGTTSNLINLQNTAGTVTNALNFSGTFTNLINSPNFIVDGSGNGDFGGTLTAGGSNAFQVASNGAVTAVGVNYGAGLLQGTGGMTVTGAANINASGAGATTIGNTGSGGQIDLQSASDINITSAATIDLTGTTSVVGLNGSYALTVTNAGTGGIARFYDSDDGANPVFSIANEGAALFQPNTDTTSAFNIKSSTGNNAFTVDTANGRVGIGLQGSNVPVLDSQGLEIQGALKLSGGAAYDDTFVTPQGSNVSTKINVPLYDPGPFGQILSFGVPRCTSASDASPTCAGSAYADTTARALSVFDGRVQAHQPTMGVFSPNENYILGFNWNGTSTNGKVMTNDSTSSTAAITLQSGAVTTNGTSGAVYVLSGDSVSGNTGNVTIDVGAASSGVAGAINLGVTNATAITIGRTGVTTTNGGATLNNTLALGDLANGNMGASAAATVDSYTSFTIAPAASGRSYTILSPTSATAGRLIYVSNIHTTNSFTLVANKSVLLNPGVTATLVWNGSAWAFAGADASNLQLAYNNSSNSATTAEIKVDATHGGLDIQDSDGGISGSLLTVRGSNASALGSSIFDVSSTGTVALNSSSTTTTLMTVTNNSATTNNVSAISANALTTGKALTITSTGTGLTTGSLLNVSSATTGAVATNGIVSLNATGNYTSTANAGLLNVSANATTAGTVASVFANALTTGIGLNVSSTGTGLTTGSLIRVSSATTGAVATNGIVSIQATGNYTSTSNAGLLGVIANSTTAGTIQRIEGNALTTGIGLSIASTGTGLTTGSLLNVSSATTGAVATNGIVSLNATGNYTSTANAGLLNVSANATTAGTVASVFANALTTGIGLNVSSTSTALTTGSLVNVSTATTGAVATNGVVAIQATGNYTSTNNAGLLNVVANSTTAGTIANISGSALTTGVALNVSANNGTAIRTSGNYVFASGANRSMSIEANTGNAAGYNLSITAGAAGAGAAAFAGGNLNLQGGAAAGTGNANGGDVNLTGGSAVGTGYQGLVNISTSAFNTAPVQTIGTSGVQAITAGNQNLYGTLPIRATVSGVIAAIGDPGQNVIGRIVYVTARSDSLEFALRLNDARTDLDIALKPNSTATLIWNGTDWTAAGASSATDLQAAYNNTQTSAGGAEIVLKSTLDTPAGTGGLTVRNNDVLAISGGLLEVQSSIGTNLFSVNDYGTELAANGGAETSGTFNTNWTSAPAGGTVTRNTTTGQYATGQAGVQVVTTTTANTGVRNNLVSNPVNSIGVTYQVSFTALSSLNGTTIDVVYSRDGGTATTACSAYGTGVSYATLSNTSWTKITCTITIDSATAATNPDLIIRKTDSSTAPTIYIDNLSFLRNDLTTRPSNVQVGGGVTGGQVTLFTFDRSSSAPLVSGGDSRYLGSMYYDTTLGSLQCYEADGWGACGSAPDNIVSYTPEYTGAVLNGTGVGTMTADFCGNGAGLSVNTSLCTTTGEARNYYKWTSPQASSQSYSIYVTYKLPSTFKEFIAGTTSLTAQTSSTANAGAVYSIYRKASGGGLTSCSADKLIVGYDGVSTTTGSADTWTTAAPTTDIPASSCASGGANAFAAGDSMVIKITVNARSNASAYIENLTFRYANK